MPNTPWCDFWNRTATTSPTRPVWTPIGSARRRFSSTGSLLSVGHDEYWSGAQRANVESARGAGVHLAFFSGNEVFWKTRWESSISTSARPIGRWSATKRRTQTRRSTPMPRGPARGAIRGPVRRPTAAVRRMDSAARSFMVNCGTAAITVAAAVGPSASGGTRASPLWRAGRRDDPHGTLGYEWNEDLGQRLPAGRTDAPLGYDRVRCRRSSPGLWLHLRVWDRHSRVDALPPSERRTRAFGAGTVQWAWGLDSNHDRGSAAPSLPMQQATVNLLADMGVQPLTLQTGTGRRRRRPRPTRPRRPQRSRHPRTTWESRRTAS